MTQMTAEWPHEGCVYSMDVPNKGWLVNSPGRDREKFHHTTHSEGYALISLNLTLIIYWIVLSGVFYLMFLHHAWLWVTETAAADKEFCCSGNYDTKMLLLEF